jgi:hypothetical protein
VGILLYGYFEVWSRWEARKRRGGGPPIPGGYRDLRDIFSEPTLFVAMGGTALVSATMFFAFTLRPVALGEAVGSGAIIMLAIALASVGSALDTRLALSRAGAGVGGSARVQRELFE